MADTTGTAGQASRDTGAAPVYSDGHLRWVLAMLTLAYVFNFLDRSIINVLSQSIKVEFALTDFQIGLLGGFFFAVFYTTCGIPVARLAERGDRVSILSGAIVIWSGMTALCGLATGFWTLALFRLGVGVGEAGCAPPAQAMISDFYPANRRASAMGIYALGVPIGTLIGTVAGGWLANDLGWRAAFVLVGLPGILLAILIRLTIKDPPRGHSEPAGTVVAHAEVPPLRAVLKVLWAKKSFVHICAGFSLVNIVGYGNTAFALPYFLRQFQLDLKTTALAVGLAFGLASFIGTFSGGIIADRMARRDKRWYAWTPGLSLCIAPWLTIAVFLQNDWTTAILLMLLPGIFHYTYLGPSFASVHNVVEPRMRASATAVLFLVINLTGLGIGPPLVGAMSDFYAAGAFAQGDFATLCPGGVGAADAAAALKASCLQASADGNRHAIITNTLLMLWAAAHYFLAARTLRRDFIGAAPASRRPAAA
jgi:MFS family permease